MLDEHAGTTYRLGYDELLIATGGEPMRPDLPGIDLPLVHGVQNLADAEVLLSLADEGCRRIVIVGGGYIGLEMAEAYIERGCTATVVERGPQPLGVIDEDFGARVADALRGRGIDVWTETEVTGFEPAAVADAGRRLPADLVVLGLGVAPRSQLAARRRHRARRQGRHPGRPAPGDERRPRVGRRRLRRVAPTSSAASRCTSPSARTPTATAGSPASTWPAAPPARRGCSARRSPSCARWRSPSPGCGSTRPREAGFDAVATTVDTTTVAGYLPHATDMTVRLVAERGTGRLLGAQIIGGPGAAKRIDTVATAITAGMTVADVMDLDLAYAPPFSSVWDPDRRRRPGGA